MEWRGMIIVDNEIPRECQIAYYLCTFGTVMDVISRIGLVRALYMPDKLNKGGKTKRTFWGCWKSYGIHL